MAVLVGAHQVGQLKRRFAKQVCPTLIFQHQQSPLNRADRCGRDVAVTQGQLLPLFANPDQQSLQILEVQQRHAFFIRDTEWRYSGYPLAPSLSSIKRDNSKGPISVTVVRTGWPLFTEKIPEGDRAGRV